MRVLVAGGGTAGHVFPALALSAELRNDGHDVRFAGTAEGPEARLVQEAGFPFAQIRARPLERRPSLRALTAPAAAIAAVGDCRPLVVWADVVVGMGGYVSVPVALASLRSRRPLVLHEQNAVPGLANRVFARAARRIALAFIEARRALPRRSRAVVTGNPVRSEILAVPGDRPRLAGEAMRALGLEEGRRTVVVFGGSQGAVHVNRSVVQAMDRIETPDLQVLLLAGNAHETSVRAALPPDGRGTLVRIVGFLEQMALAYAVADLVVARAGATTVAEIAACGLPSLLIPYPYATGRHQEANARALARANASTMLLDDELDGPVLANRIDRLFEDPQRLRQMGACARTWAHPDAAAALARVVLEAGEGA